jgi:hypothetical protein
MRAKGERENRAAPRAQLRATSNGPAVDVRRSQQHVQSRFRPDIPDSLLAKEATEILREYSGDVLFNHSVRVVSVCGRAGPSAEAARAVRRGLANIRIQAYLTAAAIPVGGLAAARNCLGQQHTGMGAPSHDPSYLSLVGTCLRATVAHREMLDRRMLECIKIVRI